MLNICEKIVEYEEYRGRVYIRKAIILELVQYRTLNQIALLSYCDLNSVRWRLEFGDLRLLSAH